MRLGWKVFIPVTLVWIAVEMVLAVLTRSAPGRIEETSGMAMQISSRRFLLASC